VVQKNLNNEKCQSLDNLNGDRFGKNNEKLEYFKGDFWETLTAMCHHSKRF